MLSVSVSSLWLLLKVPLLFLLLLLSLPNNVSAKITSHPKLTTAPAGESTAANKDNGRYIVVLVKDAASLSSVRGYQEDYTVYRYDSVLNGYALEGVPDDVMKAILDSDDVKHVYEDTMVYGIPVEETIETQQITQTGATWGIDRVDSRAGIDGVYNYDATGAGVTIFVMDTGLLGTHTEYASRFTGCTDFTGEGCSNPALHGTHVAGTSLGTTYGVAKGASLFDLKVLEKAGSGFNSNIISAFNDVAARKLANPGAKYVINASLGGGFSSALNQAVNDCVDAGVVVVVAAGNSNLNACDASPASAEKAITVGSTTITDTRSDFSNFGTCVDVFAPGSSILSASDISNTATTTLSGTSMASPHVAGIAAMYLELGLDPLTEIVNLATPNVVIDPGTGSPNRFAFNAFDLSPVAPTTIAPTVAPSPRPTIACANDAALFELDLLTDNYGEETTWDLKNVCTGAVIASGGPYEPNTNIFEELCYQDARVTFTIYDSVNDGICCTYGEGSYSIFKDGVLQKKGGQFASLEQTSFGTCGGTTLAPTGSPTTADMECPTRTSLFRLELLTDRYPGETSWELRNACDSTLVGSGGGSYLEATLYTENLCIDTTQGYTFTIKDSLSDGICCQYGIGSYKVEYKGALIKSGGDFASEEVTNFGLSCVPATTPAPTPSPTQPRGCKFSTAIGEAFTGFFDQVGELFLNP